MTVTALRPFTIGGSDAAAACGVDPFKSRIMLWAEKTGRAEQRESEAMTWGKRLEPLIAAQLEADGYDILPLPAEPLTDPHRPWLSGHPDGFVALAGEAALLEVKTTGAWAHRAADDVPPQHAAQIQHYLHLTGLRHALLAVLVGGQRLEVRELERADAAIELMLWLEQDFYEHLRRDRPPAPDGSDSARDALMELFPGARAEKVVRLDREHWRLVRELRARKAQAKVIDGQVTELENQLKAFMGDAERAISPHDDHVLSWTNVTARRVDTTALRAHRPEIASEYETVTTTRRFTLL
jgi:putative phage-type endonuclease